MKSFLAKLRRARGSETAEMPFFDHLEELRWRIVWSLAALVGATILGFVIAVRFDLLGVLKRPMDPYVEQTQLLALSVTDPFFITFKLALTLGFIMAAPIIAYQVWSFLAPALTRRERRTILPALYLGAVLFCLGVAMAYAYALPMTLKFLAGFETDSMSLAVTAGFYFSFVIKLLVAFGVMFELPVVIMILAALGLVTSRFLREKRRFAVAIMAVAAALITPGDAITATIFMMGPLMLLYELSILLTRMVERGRARGEAADALAQGAS
ncbi:MAG: twin-arginine translocase subunit TatC [Gemmatimonadota bacterium]